MRRSACPLKITDKNSWGVPNIELSNNLTCSGNPTSSPFTIDDKVYQGVDNFSWVIGKHSLRMGGEYRYNQFPQVGNEFPRGQFFFTGAVHRQSPTRRAAATPARTSLLGDTQRVDMAVALASADFRNHEWAAYIDDTWKVTPHLTITAGLRWEVAQPMLDASGHEVGIQLNQSLAFGRQRVRSEQASGVSCARAAGNFYDGVDFRYHPVGQAGRAPPVQVARDGRLGSRLINTDYNNFAPRLRNRLQPVGQMVDPHRLRHLLLAGEQELDLRSESRTRRANLGVCRTPPKTAHLRITRISSMHLRCR